MRVAFSEPLTYAVRNAPIVLESEKDSIKEVVQIGADVYDNYTYTVLLTDPYGDVTVTENFPGQDFYNTDYGHLTDYSNGGAFTVIFDSGTGTYNGVTSPRTSLNFEQLFTNVSLPAGSFTLYLDGRGGPFVPPGSAALPVAAADSYTTAQGTTLTVAAAMGLLANDTDPGGLPLTALLGVGPTHGTLALNADGSFTYTPTSGYRGADAFTYSASDGTAQGMATTVSLTVTPVDHPATANDDGYVVPNAVPSADFTIAAAAGLLANDMAPDGGLVALGIVVDGTAQTGFVRTAAGGQASVLPDGGFVYQQPFSTDAEGLIRFNGLDSFTYRVRDSDGSTADATVTLTVGSGSNHPVIASNDSYTVSNAVPTADFATTAAAGLLANDLAPDGGLVALGIVVDGAVQTGFAPTAAGGQAEVLADGRLVYRQPFSTGAQGLVRYDGPDSFTYRVRDSDGSTADANVTLTVGGGVDHPVFAADDGYAVPTALPGTDFTTDTATGVLANDYAPDGGLVALGILANGLVQTGFVRTAAGGQAQVLPDGRLVYDQPSSTDAQGLIVYRGLDSFTYRVSDSDGSTADATVTLTVGGGVNQPVFAADDSYLVATALPGTDFTTDTANGVLANDYAPDGGLVALGVVVDGAVQADFARTAAGGQAKVLADGRVVYDQPSSTDAQGLIVYNGLDSFTYRVRDSDGSTADATVTLSVGSGVNHPVFATDDSYAVSNAFPSADFATGANTGVLANDYAPDGGLVALGIVVGEMVQTGLVRTAAGGQAQVLPDGRIIYEQPFSTDGQGLVRYNGLDRFTYRVRDTDGSTADATVTLTVGGAVNHPPVAVADTLSVAAHATVAGNLIANDADGDAGDALVLTAIQFSGGQPVAIPAGGSATLPGEQGTLIVGSDGRYAYAGALPGTDPFSYFLSDGHGGTASGSVTATVTAGAAPPADATFGFGFLQSSMSFIGRQAILTGPDGVVRDVTGIGHLHFSDGTIDEADGSPLVDDLFYDAQNPDVYAAHFDPDAHYAAYGFREGRDPNAIFSTNFYLAANPDVKAAGVNPLQHYDTFGWREGRDASPDFSSKAYLALNPDVAAAGVDPLAHYLAYGQIEGRNAVPGMDGNGIAGAFDANYYLSHNPDVKAAGVDPLIHFLSYGAHEGRDPDAYFSTSAYLAANPDVAAAGLDPLIHYEVSGWKEGRSTSGFDTPGYLGANPDIAAARIDPLQHFLQYGMMEGRHGWEV